MSNTVMALSRLFSWNLSDASHQIQEFFLLLAWDNSDLVSHHSPDWKEMRRFRALALKDEDYPKTETVELCL
jgi:hypothetical protein